MPLKKEKETYTCIECGYTSLKWLGRCPECGAWESMALKKKEKAASGGSSSPIISVESVSSEREERIVLNSGGINRIFGGGMVRGGVMLLAGAPGTGKSTFALELINNMKGEKILYVTGEESAAQLKMRIDRIGGRTDFYIMCTGSAEEIAGAIRDKYDLIIVDSVQTVSSSEFPGTAGSSSTVRYVINEIITEAKRNDTAVIFIGHITKDGSIAGPKTLEHMVDAVFIMEDLNDESLRILKCTKNRFAATGETLLLQMDGTGMHIVENIDRMYLHQNDGAGRAVTCMMQGSIPFAIEVQGLVSYSRYGIPQRVSTGIPFKRMQMITGIMDKYLESKIGNMDIFINVASGIDIQDSLCDLAFIAALHSSAKNRQILKGWGFLGEMTLSGDIISGRTMQTRIAHLRQIGIKKIFMPDAKAKGVDGMEIVRVNNINDIERVL